jgi:hypothetical protein
LHIYQTLTHKTDRGSALTTCPTKCTKLAVLISG